MEDMRAMFPLYRLSDNRYSSFSSEDSCAPFTSSLHLIESSPLAANGRRRPSVDFLESSVSPGLLSASSVGTMSPTTPLNDCSFSSNGVGSFEDTHPQVNLQSLWSQQQDIFGEHDFKYSPPVLDEPSPPKCFNSLSANSHDPFSSTYTPSYHGYLGDGVSPALSRPIFADTIVSSTPLPVETLTQWSSVTDAHTPPRTINPSTIGPIVPSTPDMKVAGLYTTSGQYLESSIVLSSSPIPGYSPEVVPSQHDIDALAFFETSNLQHEATDPADYQTLLTSMQMRDTSRLSRRRYDRKGSGSGCKRRPLANKSGFECDRVIIANSFACSYPECIDKNTGKQKRFKRAEHKKRHEKTVHQKESHISHRCWVPQCERSFSRTDNLKSHLKNTHGKRSPNARNRYVATLDPNNAQYYNPDWEGDLTTEGLPMGRRAGFAKL